MLISHRIDEVEKICTRLAIMDQGVFLDQADPETLKERHGATFIFQVDPAD